MVALVGALGRLHLPQQGVHLVDGQLAVGTDCAVAGHGRQQLVLCPLYDCAGVVQCQLSQHAARQLYGVALRQ